MENLPKKNIFQIPDGYFDSLPDRILARNQQRKTIKVSFMVTTAAAAVIIFGIFLYVLKIDDSAENTLEAKLDQEIELYIESGYWQAEDILSFADNPDLILDEIISLEWGSVGNDNLENLNQFEEEWWF